MKIGIFLCFLLITSTVSFSQSRIKSYVEEKQIDFIPVSLKSGFFSVEHGNKKILRGQYKDGQKTGIWKYYDNNGKLILKRNYFNNLSYQQIFPKLLKKYSKLGIGTVKQKGRDSLGILQYHFVQEKDVALVVCYLQLNWFKDQQNIVPESTLQSAFSQLLTDKTILKYQSMEMKDTIEFSPEELREIQLIGFLSKADVFFDRSRQLDEARVIGVQPIAVNSIGDTILLPVFYYPQLRENLSVFKVNNYDYIQNLDDLFYYSVFIGPIYRYYLDSKIQTTYNHLFANEIRFLYREIQDINLMMGNQIHYFNGVE